MINLKKPYPKTLPSQQDQWKKGKRNQTNKERMLRSQDYHNHIAGVRREPSVLSEFDRYPNAEMAFNKRVVYDEIEGSHRHHHHHNPEVVERVEVVEYERVPEVRPYGGEVIYEEYMDVETSQYNPRRNRPNGLGLQKWKTYRA
uniref:Phloem specific protein n=1 Tax=Vicia faba TaxID=3906 RepID=Q41666_VICFA|nr:phloem specific protein [Vicia faba]